MRPIHVLGITLVATQTALLACATAQETLGQSGASSDVSGSSNSPSGDSGSPSSAGGSTSSQTGGSSSSPLAFGGTGGLPLVGSTGGAELSGGAGSSDAGASGGSSGTGSGGASAGSVGASAGSAGSSNGCLVGWEMSSCDTCSTQVQGDDQACSVVLKCYEDNNCSPSTCSGNDQKCGQNMLGLGSAPFPIAADVYKCRCPGM